MYLWVHHDAPISARYWVRDPAISIRPGQPADAASYCRVAQELTCMNNSLRTGELGGGSDKPPFLYEIRVQGRLSSEQWTSWFDDLAISFARGETTLRGSVPDHAALYGLLARLRDLAIPLVAVKVLDENAQRRLWRDSRRYDLMINLLVVAIYLALLGGLSTLTVFVAPIINPALALGLLFALLGGVAHVFWLWSEQPAWRWITYATWPVAVIAFLVYIPVSGLLPPALGIGILCFLLAGGLIYLVYYLRRRVEDVRASLPQAPTLVAADGAEGPEVPTGADDRGVTPLG
jgi:hypothetical protein